jgi:hypothetical protein
MIRGSEYVNGMGFTVNVYFEGGTLNKTFRESDGSLYDFIAANPDLMNFAATR